MIKFAIVLMCVCGALAGPGPRTDGDLDTAAQTIIAAPPVAPPVAVVDPLAQPTPYAFHYASNDFDGSHSHEESGDGTGRVSGRYTIDIGDGRSRTVTYVADEFGYRADVITNEPGTESRSPADATITSSALPGPDAAAAYESTRLGALAAPVVVRASSASAKSA